MGLNESDKMAELLSARMLEEKIGILRIQEESPYSPMFDTLFYDLNRLPGYKKVMEKENTRFWVRCISSHTIRESHLELIKKGYYFAYRFPRELSRYSRKYKKTIVLCTNTTFKVFRPPIEYLLHLKQKYKNVVWVMMYLDTVGSYHSRNAEEIRKEGLFDRVFSFDQADSEKYGLEFWPTPYSRMDPDGASGDNVNLFYVGSADARLPTINTILDECEKRGISFDATLVTWGKEVQTKAKIGFTSYPECVKRTQKADCILEVMNLGQTGFTLRPYEAICYNKKLLTNNKAILDFRYYKPEYMRYYQTTDEIDWDWLARKEQVDYHYGGEYSPLFLINEVLNQAGGTGKESCAADESNEE